MRKQYAYISLVCLAFDYIVRVLTGSMTINTRVTRRSKETPAPDKINTSEYFQQIFESPGRPQAKVCKQHRMCNPQTFCFDDFFKAHSITLQGAADC